jgi:hypothetical protein
MTNEEAIEELLVEQIGWGSGDPIRQAIDLAIAALRDLAQLQRYADFGKFFMDVIEKFGDPDLPDDKTDRFVDVWQRERKQVQQLQREVEQARGAVAAWEAVKELINKSSAGTVVLGRTKIRDSVQSYCVLCPPLDFVAADTPMEAVMSATAQAAVAAKGE